MLPFPTLLLRKSYSFLGLELAFCISTALTLHDALNASLLRLKAVSPCPLWNKPHTQMELTVLRSPFPLSACRNVLTQRTAAVASSCPAHQPPQASPHSLLTFPAALAEQVPCCARGAKDGRDDGSPSLELLLGFSWSTPCIQTFSAKNGRQVIVVADSVLKGAEGPICRLDTSLREVCCLCRA